MTCKETKNSSDPGGGGGSEEEDELRSLPSERKKCLLDVLHCGLRDVDLRTAQRLSAFTDEEALGMVARWL